MKEMRKMKKMILKGQRRKQCKETAENKTKKETFAMGQKKRKERRMTREVNSEYPAVRVVGKFGRIEE